MSEEERRIDKKKSLPVWGWVGIDIVLLGLILGGFALQGRNTCATPLTQPISHTFPVVQR